MSDDLIQVIVDCLQNPKNLACDLRGAVPNSLIFRAEKGKNGQQDAGGYLVRRIIGGKVGCEELDDTSASCFRLAHVEQPEDALFDVRFEIRRILEPAQSFRESLMANERLLRIGEYLADRHCGRVQLMEGLLSFDGLNVVDVVKHPLREDK
jgi:hypothetical protein